MRIVIDTNIWISGLLWQGPAWHVLQLAEKERIELCMTPPMLDESIPNFNHAYAA